MIRSRFAAAAVGLLAAGTMLAVAAPAFADTTAPTGASPTVAAPVTPPAPCAGTTAPTAKCTVAGVVGGSAVTVTIPGIGALNITLSAAGVMTGLPGFTAASGSTFTATSAHVNGDGTAMTVTFVAPAVGTTPKQVVKAKITLTPGVGTAAPTVAAIVGPKSRHHHEDDAKESGKDDDDHASSTATTGGSTNVMSVTTGHGHDDGNGSNGNNGNNQD